MIKAKIQLLHKSDFYRITDYRCYCDVCSLSEPEYSNSFCLSFVRKGFFEYRVFRHDYEVHVGRALLSKPGFEHRARHIDDHPDITTVFEFKPAFYELLKDRYGSSAGSFLDNNDLHALMIPCNAAIDYQHHHIVQLIQSKLADTLQIDELVIDLLDKILRTTNGSNELQSFPDKFKKFHLRTIEKATEYMRKYLSENISLENLSKYCCVSPFHFSRMFKAVMGTPPHRYLLDIRLQHAKILLTVSSRPVSDIAFECGFNSIEHFATAYRHQFHISPTQTRILND